jgi:iduronate 2-sulfatase
MNLSATCILSFALLILSVGARGEEYDVYLLAGQSNMDGRGIAAELSEEQRVPAEKTIIFYRNPPHASDGWQPLAPGFSIPPKHKGGIPSTTFGPEIGFASALSEALPDKRFALIKGSRGGTSLRADWNPGIKDDPKSQGVVYRNFMETVRLATNALTETVRWPCIWGPCDLYVLKIVVVSNWLGVR